MRIKRKQVSSKQMTMMPAKFLRPWQVLELDILELDQKSTSQNRYPVGVVDTASTLLFKYPLSLKGDLKISRKLYVTPSDPGRCRGGVYGTSGETSVSGPEKVDSLRHRQSNTIARICRKDGGCRRNLASLGFFSGTSVYCPSAGFKVLPHHKANT